MVKSGIIMAYQADYLSFIAIRFLFYQKFPVMKTASSVREKLTDRTDQIKSNSEYWLVREWIGHHSSRVRDIPAARVTINNA